MNEPVVYRFEILSTPMFSVQLAHAVDHDSYALIFGFNTFIALLLMTGLTFVVADEHGLDLDIRKQVLNSLDNHMLCILIL